MSFFLFGNSGFPIKHGESYDPDCVEDMNVDDMAALAFLLLHHSNILAITVSWILKIFSRYENDGNHFNRAMRGKGTLKWLKPCK